MYRFFIVIIYISSYIYADTNNTINTLLELQNSKTILQNEIKIKTKQKNNTTLDDEKIRLEEEIKRLNTNLTKLENKFNAIASGMDTSLIKSPKNTKENTLTEDFHLLIKPLIESAKEITKDMRKKAMLQEEINYYKKLLPQVTKAYKNITHLLKKTKNKKLRKKLLKLQKHWQQQITIISSNLNASKHQIQMLEGHNLSFTQSLQKDTKNFFQKRGLFLFEGLIAFFVVLIVMQLIYILAIKLFPVLVKPNRPFSLRLLDLLYHTLVIFLAIIVPMGVFYYEEDWVLFSFGVLILFGIAWTFRHFISNLWQQARLLLNIGSVRENERIFYQGLPWRVKNINIFTIIENPTSGVSLRIPIEELIGLTSRPSHPHEPWFPCKLNDWIILSNEYYGKVIGISFEFIELEDIGGGHKTYLVSDFLSLSPRNLSTDFRIVTQIGISYKHQKDITTIIVTQLEEFILEKIEKEEYKNGLKKLIVEFENAGDSSLNIAVIANFKGFMAPIHNRLYRAIGRWCVDACTHYNWEIPFPQLTIHKE